MAKIKGIRLLNQTIRMWRDVTFDQKVNVKVWAAYQQEWKDADQLVLEYDAHYYRFRYLKDGEIQGGLVNYDETPYYRFGPCVLDFGTEEQDISATFNTWLNNYTTEYTAENVLGAWCFTNEAFGLPGTFKNTPTDIEIFDAEGHRYTQMQSTTTDMGDTNYKLYDPSTDEWITICTFYF